jgi:hypothetical protein
LDVAPEWLRVWASLVCEYLEYEETRFPQFFKSDYEDNFPITEIMIDAKAQKETQIQNIAITIDKITHVLDSMGTKEPPIKILSFEDRYNRLWCVEGCLKENVKIVLD